MSAVVLRGDARALPLPDESVDLVVTSPPYWSLRDYRDGGQSLAGQIGAEETWQEYIANLLDCTREWVRVLKPSGSIFVVIGDKYANDAKWGGATSGKHVEGLHGQTGIGRAKTRTGIPAKSLIGLPWRYALACVDELGLILRAENIWSKVNGLPESVEDRTRRAHEQGFHFTRQGRYFAAVDEIREPHLMKPQRRQGGHLPRPALGTLPPQTYSTSQRDGIGVDGHPLGKLPGSVWEIPSSPLFVPERIEHARCCGGRKRPGCTDGLDHHAAFPPALAKKIILGWSPSGICTGCGDGRFPVTESERVQLRQRDQPSRARLNREPIHGMDQRAGTHVLRRSAITGYACACTPFTDHPGTGESSGPTQAAAIASGNYPLNSGGQPRRTAHPGHAGLWDRPKTGPWREHHFEDWTPARTGPAVVLDPFGGTGTTAMVADVLGRTGIAVDLSADYCRLAQWRTKDPAERARALGVPKPPPVPEGQTSLFGEAS